YVAPPDSGQLVSERIRLAARRLHWSFSRARDVWYADPRVSLKSREMRKIEEISGVRYGRQERSELDALIAKADALLVGPEADFFRPYVTALRTFFGAIHSP